jgi:hypothetical protein
METLTVAEVGGAAELDGKELVQMPVSAAITAAAAASARRDDALWQ